MDIRILIPIIMAVLLLSWVIFCGIQFIRHSKDVIVRSDFTGHVKCEKCGTEYTVNAAEFTKTAMAKSISVTKTKFVNGTLINQPHYKYYAKKFYCPVCGKRRYARVLNINDINQAMKKPMLQSGIRWLILMMTGGLLILAATGIPMYFANKAAVRQVEELKQQQYEDFLEDYVE